MAYSIGTYHLADNPQLFEPSRNNAFDLIITGVDSLLPAGLVEETALDSDRISNGQDIIRLSVAESFVPHLDLDVIEVKRGNSTMKFAGTPTFSEGSIKVNDYVGARTKDVLLAMQALAYDVNKDVIKLSSNYKHDWKLLEYTPDYAKVIRQWTLKGCWIKTLSEGSFSHDSPDKRQIDVTIIYDRAIPEIPTEE